MKKIFYKKIKPEELVEKENQFKDLSGALGGVGKVMKFENHFLLLNYGIRPLIQVYPLNENSIKQNRVTGEYFFDFSTEGRQDIYCTHKNFELFLKNDYKKIFLERPPNQNELRA